MDLPKTGLESAVGGKLYYELLVSYTRSANLLHVEKTYSSLTHEPPSLEVMNLHDYPVVTELETSSLIEADRVRCNTIGSKDAMSKQKVDVLDFLDDVPRTLGKSWLHSHNLAVHCYSYVVLLNRMNAKLRYVYTRGKSSR